MTASAALQTLTAKYAILQVELPSRDPVNIGVLLEDPQSDRLYLRLRRDLDSLTEEADDLEVLSSAKQRSGREGK